MYDACEHVGAEADQEHVVPLHEDSNGDIITLGILLADGSEDEAAADDKKVHQDASQ